MTDSTVVVIGFTLTLIIFTMMAAGLIITM